MIGILADEEGAQANGLAIALVEQLRITPPTTPAGIQHQHSGVDLLRYIFLTCLLHFHR